jgi:hypothetical protein
MNFSAFKTLFIILLILMTHPPFSFSSDAIPYREIVSAAQQGIETFVRGPRVQNLHKFGFFNQRQIDEAALGEGFQVFTIPPDWLLSQESPKDMNALALPTNLWQFLIVTGGKSTSLLTVDLFNDRWTAVSIGASGLATELEILLNAWPLSAGYHYRLLRVYQAKSDFIEILQGGRTIGVVPFTSCRMAMNLENREFDPLDLHDPTEILTKLQPIVRMNIQ